MDLQYKIKNGLQTVSISEEARDIIFKLLNKNPKKRLGYYSDFKEILLHPWFKEIDF
jgi:serine/threonine protein kinase